MLVPQCRCKQSFCVSGIGHHIFTVRVIGDFTEKLAREFFSTHCVPNLSEALLQSFVLLNVLHVRRATDLRNRVDAHGNNLLDIPADPEGRKMITAVSPAQQFAMTRLVNKLSET